MCFVSTYAVAYALGRSVLQHLAETMNQIVLDAAARDRAHHRTAFAQSHDGAHGARRAPPCVNNCGQQRGFPGLSPFQQRPQNYEVQVLHWSFGKGALGETTQLIRKVARG